MNALLKLAGCIALLAASWCAGEWALAFRSVRHVADELPALVADEAELTRQAAVDEIRAGRADATVAIDRFSARAAHQIDRVRASAQEEVRRLRADLVTQSTLWRGEVARQAGTANDTLAGLRSDLAPTLSESADVMRQLDEAAPLWLDCDHNPSCAYNLFQGTAKSIQSISQDVKKVTPQITQDAAATTHNLKRMTSPLSWPAKIGHAALSVAKRIWIF